MNDAINAAVKWWRDMLRDAKQDAGDSHLNLYLGAMTAIQPFLTDQQLDDFCNELTLGLETRLRAAEPGLRPEAHLDVDYSPEGLLYAAAKKGRIGSMYFPCKTHMRVHANHVEVACGYGQPYKTIYRKAASA